MDKILEILGFSVGLLYLWWEYHADWKLWYASMVMPAISMWIYFSKGIYADFAINIYYLAIAVYGYVVWTRGHKKAAESEFLEESEESERSEKSEKSEESGKSERSERSERSEKSEKSEKSDHSYKAATLAITNIPGKMLAACIGVFFLLWVVLYLILNYLTDSTVPIPDAFTTALSIVGMWMLARKYLQQWIAWILVDAVCACLYWYKGIPLYGILYALYTVIAFFGYRKWLRLMHAEKSASSC
ncbi:MAG: nicotinamide riboside transporter PnuC [Muribaculaceae bacterium]|nr:nicotinamide riboside transporter PnuC [Muribaculaceae bacterium]